MKKIKIIFILFLLMPSISYAEVKCSEIVESYNNFIDYSNKTANLNCTTNQDLGINEVNACNDFELKKSLELSKLYKYEESNDECYNASIQQILDDNRNKCSSIIDEDLKNLLKKILMIFYLVGPILVVIFGSLDFTKAVVASDEKVMKKAREAFVKRLIALLLLLLSPEIVNLLVGLINEDSIKNTNGYSCDYNYIRYTQKYNVTAVETTPNVVRIRSNGLFTSNSSANEDIIFKQGDPRWANDNLFCSTNDTIGSAGCALTSTVVQIKNSGVPTILPELNPGTFSAAIVNNGRCTSGSAIDWHSYVNYITDGNLIAVANRKISGNYSDKIQIIANYINQGYYPVIQVKYGTYGNSHYVAPIYASNGELYVVDPANVNDRQIAPVNHSYPFYSETYDSQIILFQKQ